MSNITLSRLPVAAPLSLERQAEILEYLERVIKSPLELTDPVYPSLRVADLLGGRVSTPAETEARMELLRRARANPSDLANQTIA